MKTILFLFIIILVSCNHKPIPPELMMPSQVPPQVIYAGINSCNAPVPDYTTKITATDNCKISWLLQDPAPGLILTPEKPTVIITMRAGDVSNNIVEMKFTLTLVDTIKPVFVINPSLITEAWKTVDVLYDTADRWLFQIAKYDQILSYDLDYIPRPVGNSYFAGLERRVYPVRNSYKSMGVTYYNYDGVAQVDTSMFYNKRLVINTPAGHTLTGIGKRTFTFE